MTGEAMPCSCADGASGTRTCDSIGYFGACVCNGMFGGGGGGSGGGGGFDGGSGGSGGSGGGGGANAPTILSLDVSPTTITEGGSVTITATVMDPGGASNLVDGALSADTSSASYGSFTSTTPAGTYVAHVTWNQLNDVQPLDFVGSPTRSLVATFANAHGGQTSQPLDITVTCSSGGACGGVCHDPMTDRSNWPRRRKLRSRVRPDAGRLRGRHHEVDRLHRHAPRRRPDRHHDVLPDRD